MTETEQSCRICRGEASATQPLIHPCKCRGSIKYIHQECLLEWLEHSNNKARRCDICDAAYRFRTIYDADMPATMPAREVAAKVAAAASAAVVRHVAAALYVVCAVQVPVFWKFVGRLFTHTVDGKVPVPDSSVGHVVLYGAYAVRTRGGALFAQASAADRAWTFFVNTFVSGCVQSAAFVVVLVVVFIEREWVVREVGYTKLLLREVGREPKARLAELLGMIAHNERGDSSEARARMAARALEDLQRPEPDANAFRAALAAGGFDDMMAGAGGGGGGGGVGGGGAAAAPADLDSDSDDEPAEELERRQNFLDDDMAAADANNNLLDLLGLRLNVSTPLQLMVVADFVVLLVLFNAYLVPHMLGTFACTAASYVVGAAGALWPRWARWPWPSPGPLAADVAWLRPAHAVLVHGAVEPVAAVVRNVLARDAVHTPTAVERAVYLAVGYAAICFAVHRLMAALRAGDGPVVGGARRAYKVLFQVTATAKVFAIFAIEIVLFPLYCGWLLDFCAAPLLNRDLVAAAAAGPRYQVFLHMTSRFCANGYFRGALYWAAGTAYMYCIALFVSMVRGSVLRPGVLYFIKSPEDPNARLIHDAIVKPFRWQMSRILLSARVYTAFVVLGIGAVTWSMRLALNPDGAGALLPIQVSLHSALFAATLLRGCAWARPMVARHFRSFWRHSFAVLCHRLRLSHFLLGSPVPQERGYVVYRSWLHKALGLGAPDYAKPVSLAEARAMFRADPAVSACFVPNGNYLRVPSSDDNSRRFLKSLFVAVTKADQPLEPVPEPADDNDWWDDDVVYENAYTVVYSPPNTRLRCLVLVTMVAVFAALLGVSVAVTACLLGRLVVHPMYVLYDLVGAHMSPSWSASEGFTFAQADLSSFAMGLHLQLLILASYEKEAVETANLDDLWRWAAEPARAAHGWMPRASARLLAVLAQCSLSLVLHWVYMVQVEKLLFGQSVFAAAGHAMVFEFAWPGVLLHLCLTPWTVLPVAKQLLVGLPRDEDWRRWAARLGLLPMATCYSFVVGHAAMSQGLAVLERRGQVDAQVRAAVASRLHVATLAAVLATKTLHRLQRVLRHAQTQIRNEKYVRGTAVENNEE